MKIQRVVFEIYESTHAHTDRQTSTLIAMLSVPTGYEVTRPTLLHSTFCILEFDHVGSPVVLSQTETVLRV